MGIKKAKSKEVKKVDAGALGASGAAAVHLDRIYMPEKTKRSQIFDGPAKEAAAQLVEKLRFEARVI
jgi:electron transfer flavoprotein beta subunit